MQFIEFRINFTGVKGPIDNIPGLDNSLAPNRWQAIIWANDDPVQRCIYASLGLNEFNMYLPFVGKRAERP